MPGTGSETRTEGADADADADAEPESGTRGHSSDIEGHKQHQEVIRGGKEASEGNESNVMEEEAQLDQSTTYMCSADSSYVSFFAQPTNAVSVSNSNETQDDEPDAVSEPSCPVAIVRCREFSLEERKNVMQKILQSRYVHGYNIVDLCSCLKV